MQGYRRCFTVAVHHLHRAPIHINKGVVKNRQSLLKGAAALSTLAADPAEQFHRVVTAARSWRGQVEEAEARARVGARQTWVYQLDFEQAKHMDDIGLAFGTAPDMSPARAAMSRTVMDAFVRFARTGNPGWPAYDLGKRQTMVFDTESRVVSNPRQWERELFARVPYVQPGT